MEPSLLISRGLLIYPNANYVLGSLCEVQMSSMMGNSSVIVDGVCMMVRVVAIAEYLQVQMIDHFQSAVRDNQRWLLHRAIRCVSVFTI